MPFPTIRFSLFDRMARVSTPVILDAELMAGVWHVPAPTAADAQQVAK